MDGVYPMSVRLTTSFYLYTTRFLSLAVLHSVTDPSYPLERQTHDTSVQASVRTLVACSVFPLGAGFTVPRDGENLD
jgi:Trk-type K+ transport system membrane component